jgi:hypothetical protein
MRLYPTQREGSLDWRQAKARRALDWLHDFEVGRPDPITGRVTPRPPWLIAAIAGVSLSTVYRGINLARELRETLAEGNPALRVMRPSDAWDAPPAAQAMEA